MSRQCLLDMSFGGLFAKIIWRLLISKYLKSCLLVLQTSIPISHLFKHPFLDLFWALWNREYPLTVPAPHTNVTALVPAPGCLGWVGEVAVAQYYFHGRKITTINYKDASVSQEKRCAELSLCFSPASSKLLYNCAELSPYSFTSIPNQLSLL